MKKVLKIFAILLGLIVLGIIIIAVITIPAENKLKEEISKMYDVVDEGEINYEEADKYLTRTVSSGDNKNVEKAVKEYASKYVEFNKLFDKLNNDEVMNVTSIANVEKEKPNFDNSLKLLNEANEDLKTMNLDLDYLFNKDGMAYELIKHKTEDEYSVGLYEELTINNNLGFNKEDKELREALNQINDVVNTNKELIMFLKNNPSVWSIENGNISFIDDVSYNQYMNIVK